MASENLGVTEGVSMALGGMIGGGIYAVLGVVTQITGAATWAAFVAAAAVAVCAGYSYNQLNALAGQNGGSVTFVQCFTGNSTLAGMVGWTLLIGYVGSMAMYAFAFAEFTLTLPGVPDAFAGVPLRPAVSVLVVGLFVLLNTLGARVTGSVENVMVALKVGILVLFGVAGVAYIYLVSPQPAKYGFSALTSFHPIMAAGVSFVAFQGWQLLFYDQESMTDPVETIRKSVYVAIPVAVAIYILVAVATFNLAPAALKHHPHTALKDAASNIMSVAGLAELGGLVIALSALFSTGSAINATLFSSGYFAKGMLSKDLLPDHVGDAQADGIPRQTLVVLGAVTAALTAYGSLEAITSFASIAFIVVFGGMSLLAFRNREQAEIRTTPPLLGTVGAFGFLPLLLYRLYTESPEVFGMVFVLAVVVLGAELLYFEHEAMQAGISEFHDGLEDGIQEVSDGLDDTF